MQGCTPSCEGRSCSDCWKKRRAREEQLRQAQLQQEKEEQLRQEVRDYIDANAGQCPLTTSALGELAPTVG